MGNFKLGSGIGSTLAAALLTLSVGCSGSANNGGGGGEGGEAGTAGTAGTGGSGGSNGGSAGSGGKHEGGEGGAAPVEPKELQLNDVSVLFPLPETPAEVKTGLLAVSTSGARGKLLPEALYTAVGPIAGTSGEANLPGAQLLAPYANLRIVALRVDPCFAELEPPMSGEGCLNQLRLIAQEVGVGGAEDSALHLFYSISRDELLEIVHDIGTLREQQAPGQRLGKLAPHPIMAEQGLSGAMAEGVRKLILARAGVDNLTRITRMSARGGPFWDFSGFDVKDGKATPFGIPTLPKGSDQKQTFNRGFGGIEQEVIDATPPSGSPDDFMVLMNMNAAQALEDAERTALLTSLLRVENPGHHSPNTVDCVSCHVATPAIKQVIEPLLGLELPDGPERFHVAEALVPSKDLEATFESDDAITNVHAFSYLGKKVGINQRTVNESAAVVAYLTELLAE